MEALIEAIRKIETKEIEQGVTDVTTKALALKVMDTPTYEIAGQILLLHKDMEKKIKDYFKPLKSKSYDTWKSICSAENEELGKLQPGVAHLSKEMTAYNLEQEKIGKAEEERLRRKALKKEEEERLQAAIEAEKEGNKDEAEAILEEPVFVPSPIVLKAVPKVNGLAQRTNWKYRLTDLNALVKAVYEGKVPLMALEPNDIFLNQQARALKGTVQYPGVEFYSETSMGGARR
jgi:hypothetical protein